MTKVKILDKTFEPFIDAKQIDKAVFPGIQGGPLEHIIAGKAVCFKEAMNPNFKKYQEQIVKNAKTLAEGLIKNGLRLVSGGTDNHLVLVDLRPFNVTGKVAETVLDEIGITVNKNTIPFDPEKPMVTSGIRVGTPALTTRGMKEGEMRTIADLISQTLKHHSDENKKKEIKGKIAELCKNFPLYG